MVHEYKRAIKTVLEIINVDNCLKGGRVERYGPTL